MWEKIEILNLSQHKEEETKFSWYTIKILTENLLAVEMKKKTTTTKNNNKQENKKNRNTYE